jgi:thymidine kinase
LDSAQNRGEVISNVINVISNYMSPLFRQLGQNVNVSEIRREIQNIGGVNTVSTIDIFNLVGGQYSSNETSQRYLDDTTRQILLIDETIFAQPNQVYQVRIPSKDIQVRVKTLTSTSFS